MRTPPTVKYNGLTVLLSHPGRFDTNERGQIRLCNGPANRLLEDALSETPVGRYGIDFRTIECREPLLPGTKVVLACGDRATLTCGIPTNRFHAMRGAPITKDGVVYIPTYHLQDACDVQNYEERLNPALIGLKKVEEEAETKVEREESDASIKEYGKTSRKNFYAWTKYDIRKAARILKHGVRKLITTEPQLLFSPTEGASILDNLDLSVYPLYLDLETDPLSGRIICCGFGITPNDVWSVSLQPRMYGSVEDLPSLARFYQALVRAFCRATQVVIHNAQFDLFILSHIYKIPPPAQNKIYDTMVAHHRLYNGLEKSLGHCISLYTDEPYHKDTAIFTPHTREQLRQLLLYNARDVSTMALIHREQTIDANGFDARSGRANGATGSGMADSIRQANILIRPLLLKAIRGMVIDKLQLCRYIDNYRERGEIIEQRILPILAGSKRFNVRSPKQVGELLYNTWQLPRPFGPGASLTGKETLYGLSVQYPLPTLKAIVASREAYHNSSQLGFRIWRGDRVTSHLEATTDTFRLRSRALFGLWGTNVQNWPKKLRAVVKAKPGHKLAQVDQKNAEALIVAYLVRPDTRYRKLLLSGIKLHTYVALFLFKHVWDQLLGEDCERFMRCPIEKLRQEPRIDELDKIIRASDNNEPSTRWYYMAKQTGLSANYGVGAREFSKNTLKKSGGEVFIPINKAERFLSIYRDELFPEIKTQFQDYVKRCAQEGVLYNMFGYPRILQEHPQKRVDEYFLKQCYAWIAQSTVGTITNIADSEIQERLDSGEYHGFEIWTNTHDSLLSHAPEDRAIEVGRTVQKHMNQTLTNPFGETFQMGSDLSIGDDWYNVKEIK